MVVCKFFLQGNCRYGNNCWHDHPSGGNQGFSVTAQRQLFGGNKSGGQNQSQVSFGQNRFKWISPDAQQQQQQQQQNRGGGGANQQLSTGDTVKALASEVQTMFEEGKMWPFTCLGFEKELPSLPGFNDVSMEEVRFDAYVAQKTGTIQQFEQKFRSLANEVMQQHQELKNPNMTLKQKLIGFIDDAKRKKNSSSAGQTSLFGGPSSSSGLFASGASTNSGFGGGTSGGLFGSTQPSNPPSTGLFGQKPQTGGFGQTGQQSLFGQAPSLGQSSTFGQTSTFGQSSGFGQPGQSGGTLFGKPTGQTGFGQTNTVFGQPSNQALPSFGQPQTPKSNLFGDNSSTKASFPASSSTTQSAFGSSTPIQASQNPSVPFGGVVVPSGGFGGGTTTTTTTNTAAPAQPEDSAYTPVDKLTAQELDQFRSQTFTKVPLRPPPREFCF